MKRCTGCGILEIEDLGLNSKGEKYLACCPDSNYVECTEIEILELIAQYKILSDIEDLFIKNSRHKVAIFIDKKMREILNKIKGK